MLITKKNVCIIFATILVICITTICFGITDSSVANLNNGTIVIDAGHGGIDGGVCIENIKESEINLEMSNMLEIELKKLNFKVTQTRKTSHALADGKSADMKARAELINKIKPILVISMHVNKYKNANRRGVQVFYDDTENSKEVGERMQSVINTFVNKKYCGRTDLNSLGGDYFITKCSESKSIIIECGFLSNFYDRQLLMDNQYRKELCMAIAKGVESMQDISY